MRIEVIEPHGFCAGVERALKMAQEALSDGGQTIYGLHEIVHNELVVQDLVARGMRFVESVEEVPAGAIMLISAHGTSSANRAMAERRQVKIIDATCPFVAAAHAAIRTNFKKGMRTVIIGEPGHVEVRGYLGEQGACLPEDVKPDEKTGRVVQTTLDAGAHEGVCTATRDRQQAVREFVAAHRRDASVVGVLAIGSGKSANSRRLAEIAEQSGAKAWRIGSPEEIRTLDLSGIDVLGVTSGASTPETALQAVLLAFYTERSSCISGRFSV